MSSGSFVVLYNLSQSAILPFVLTTNNPLSINKFVTSTASFKRPPGLPLKSNIRPFKLLSLLISLNASATSLLTFL